MGQLADLSRAIAAVARGTEAPREVALVRATGARRLDERHTNHVWFADLDSRTNAVKVFVGQQDDNADREWSALHHLRSSAGLGSHNASRTPGLSSAGR